jgi:hypothetical protein
VSRLNRVLFVTSVMLMLMCSVAMANVGFSTPVRVASLGGGDGFNGNFLNDSNGAYKWFGRIYRNADHARVTWTGGTNNSFGLLKGEEGYGTYMIHLQKGFMDSMGEYNHFTLGYGMPLGGIDWGVIYNRQNIANTMGTVEYTEAWNTFGVGGSWDMDDETLIDFVFQMITGSEDDGVDEDPENDVDYSQMDFGVRAFRQLRDDVTVVPAFWFMTGEDSNASVTSGYMGVGVAFDYTVNDNNDVVVGFSYQKSSYEAGDPAVESSVTTMPGAFLALETELTDMFTVRMGASKSFDTADNGLDGDSFAEAKTFPYGYTLGMGIGLGDWVIDLELNQSWLYDFGYWVHGTTNSDNGQSPIAKIEGKYWF